LLQNISIKEFFSTKVIFERIKSAVDGGKKFAERGAGALE